MRADIQFALNQLNISWKWFEHKGKPMTKKQVKACLEYGQSKGYKHTGELSDEEIDSIIEFENLSDNEGDGSKCCGKNMIIAPSGIVYHCLKCGNWEYSSS